MEYVFYIPQINKFAVLATDDGEALATFTFYAKLNIDGIIYLGVL